ncbi:hypothetical protein GOV06_00930 [Candidatus Woesearchaeota archaeon]|nr:hypothetical protein [Candidatus Woesearchaeota archaeon]
MVVYSGLMGGIGGFVRSVVGILKALKRKEEIKIPYALLTILIAVIIGVFAGIIFSYDWRVSLLAGYAGTDVLEGAYKSLKK